MSRKCSESTIGDALYLFYVTRKLHVTRHEHDLLICGISSCLIFQTKDYTELFQTAACNQT
jgi:hypothetical protein